ncbi:MAG: hypothetical protein HKL91_06650 [Candidatus Eremiobacteraeota bacterium]|uniref:Putative Holliday junction ATP-dependent DNA helicase ruvA n=1 Tax=mine drainage metagenome TaxID=410659 RepID=E6PDW2_9ZZZZ|nr:hypothetical protein [Candidatus Eremiobacteraeota bacterium]
MFSRIEGRLIEREGERVMLDVGGLGYEIFVPPCVAEKLPTEPGASVRLEIYSVLSLEQKSGRFSYYGFSNAVERSFFEALLGVSSIGPRSAVRAFSVPMNRIAAAIERGDHTFLKTLPGIGQQKARDIVAKLQGKVARFLLIQEAPEPTTKRMPDFADEALAVLLQLEYRRAEAEQMLRDVLEARPEIADAERLLAAIYERRSVPAADTL